MQLFQNFSAQTGLNVIEKNNINSITRLTCSFNISSTLFKKCYVIAGAHHSRTTYRLQIPHLNLITFNLFLPSRVACEQKCQSAVVVDV